MTDTIAATPNWQRRLSNAQHEAVQLQGLMEGASVLYDEADSESNGKMARNALVPLLEVILTRCGALADELGGIETEARRNV